MIQIYKLTWVTVLASQLRPKCFRLTDFCVILCDRTICGVSTDFSGVDICKFDIRQIIERNNCRLLGAFAKQFARPAATFSTTVSRQSFSTTHFGSHQNDSRKTFYWGFLPKFVYTFGFRLNINRNKRTFT